MLDLLCVILVTFVLFKTNASQNYGLPSGDVCLAFEANPNSQFAKDCFQNLDECQQVMKLLRKGIGCVPACGKQEICVMVHGKLQCNCTEGYQGKDCSTEINECGSNPCQNGATCNDELSNYNCACVSGYTGKNCHIDINECVSNPCQNGATCNDELNSYSCDCVFVYTGMNCDVALPINPIVSNGYYYWLTTSQQSWQDSRNECQSLGGDLASVGVKTRNERRRLAQDLSTNAEYIWIGGNDFQVQGTFRWLDGTLVGSNEWDSGQPQGIEHCLCMQNSNRRLHDCICSGFNLAICSK